MTAPTLTGFTPAITFDENTLNATPQLLDGVVDFQDAEGDFNGGQLTLTGLLAEDRVSIRNEGVNAGQIGLSGTDVTFGGVVIGALAGGSGATLTITFNAAATSAAIDALIQNLTYANVSNAPTASRNLILNVTDAAGNGLGGSAGGSQTFAQQAGSNSPFNNLNIGNAGVTPALVDVDDDGDLDMVVGSNAANLRYYSNTNGVFTEQSGGANPFNGLGLNGWTHPAFADLDGDGDLDLVVNGNNGGYYGGYGIRTFQNNGGTFSELSGSNNPFLNVGTTYRSAPAFADMDGDGDLDFVVSNYDQLRYFRNDAGVFSEQGGAGNPFNGVYFGDRASPTFLDLDGDGDVDVVVGQQNGTIRTFRNNGSSFTELAGSANPFNGVNVGYRAAPEFADVDGDGDMDLVVGGDYTNPTYFLNTTPRGETVTVTVTPQNDALTASGLPTDATVLEDRASNLDLSGLTLSDPDVVATITMALTASEGTLTAVSSGGVTVTGSASGVLTLVGTASAIDAWLNTVSNLRYTGALNDVGADAATVTVTIDEGDGAYEVGVVNVDITDMPEPPVLTGLAAAVTFGENDVNATPALLDIDVDFSDFEDTFSGGALIISGLLAEDRVAVNNQGADAGQIGLSGTDVTYEGVVIGTLSGGAGGALTVTFNAAANSVAIDALIQNLTYANVSNAPTPTRNLTVTVRDADALTSVTPITVNVTPQNDAATVTGVPTDLTAIEETSTTVNLSGVTVSDPDVTAALSVILTASTGTLTATSAGGVTVTGSASGVLTLTGTGAAIDAYLNNTTAVRYTGGSNVAGLDAATITFATDEGAGPVTVGTITVDITDTPEPPVLTGFSPTLTFAENTVNATPQIMDADVEFSDFEQNFTGGRLTITGVLAEDRISVNNEGTDAGQIGLSGADVTYGGVVIGTLAGGSGTALTITFNAAADNASVDALIQNLTYANVSNAPTATRNLGINVTDADGLTIGGAGGGGAQTFTQQTGAANPFSGFAQSGAATPFFGDFDNDGDQDMVVGSLANNFRYFTNAGGVFTERTGAQNPFNGIFNSNNFTDGALVDLDADGDLDFFQNNREGGAPRTWFNTNGVLSERTGAQNPFSSIGLTLNYRGSPTFVDLDGDGDLDLVASNGGGLRSFFNAGGVFAERTGAANPFNGVSFAPAGQASPTFLDLDGDGDLDVVSGQYNGLIRTYRNNGSGSFTELTGSANPFNGVDVGERAAPTFADVDGDGDMDLVTGGSYGAGSNALTFHLNTSPRGQTVTVSVTAQNDALTFSGLRTDIAVTEEIAGNVDFSALTLSDPDVTASITMVLTASSGTLRATSSGGVTVTGSASGVLTLVGTASAIDTYLNTAANVRYTGALDVQGEDAATITVTVEEGDGPVTLGVVNVDITNTLEAPILTDLATSVTFAENTVNATPQLLDIDVTFSDFEDTFAGGALRLTGLLAEDRVSVNNEGTDAGQIGLSGSDVTYEGVVIGTLAGGSGSALTITFNAAANSVAIDALVQNLTYANVSNTPTATRNFSLNITDSAGLGIGGASAGAVTFAQQTGASNPFNGINTSSRGTPEMADVDGDGDLDLVFGSGNGGSYGLRYFNNAGGVFTERTGAQNPFAAIRGNDYNSPSFTDLDGDGDQDLVLHDRDTNSRSFFNTNGVFTERTGAQNPLNGFFGDYRGSPVFVDFDGDGDRDYVLSSGGSARFFQNNANVFTERTGANNPFNGDSFGSQSALAFIDIDGDGDLDVVAGQAGGTLRTFRNDGNSTFAELTGAANPFNGASLGQSLSPNFADVDNDGDLDLVTGSNGAINYFLNNTPRGQTITVNVTAQNDALTVTGVPADVTVIEEIASNLDLSAITLTDLDVTDSLTVVLTASTGILTATSGGGVTVTGSTSGALTLVGTASAIDAYLNVVANIRYTGASNVDGDNAATITVTTNEGSGAVERGVVNVDITNTTEAPILTGFATSLTFAENTVNATPQLLDIEVEFSDFEDTFDGGSLRMSGLLAEDRVSVRNEGTDAGQIGLSGTDVTYEGVVIGTLAGGSGNALTITFNAAATSVSIDALIQNLTYANVSGNPTATRNLALNITDADGQSLIGTGSAGALTFAPQTGASNPFNGISFPSGSTPTFADLDADGDQDIVVGSVDGTLRYFTNASGVFTERTGGNNPFSGIDVGNWSDAAIADFDGDGDLDLMQTTQYGTPRSFFNTNGVFAERTGAQNPFGSIGLTADYRGSPTFVDLDGDGDLDLVVGNRYSTNNLRTFFNTGGVFAERTGAANPLNSLNPGSRGSPTFLDLDGDGDLDIVAGQVNGTLRTFSNNGNGTFSELTGSANPFNGVDVGDRAAPTFADVDGDGDMDLVTGGAYGANSNALTFHLNTSSRGQIVTVNVTTEADAVTAATVPTDVTVVEDLASSLDLSAIVLTDPDVIGNVTVVLTASAGTMVAVSSGGVTVTGSASGVLTLAGTTASIDAYLNNPANIRYTGAANVFGDNVATVTITADGGAGSVTLGTVNVDITGVNDAPTLTGFGPVNTFIENATNAGPQLLDLDVTFSDLEEGFSGGALTLSGLLAEDRVSVRNEGADAGQIGLSGTDVTYGGVVIGALSGGAGNSLIITFNAAADGVSIDALIQNLTYANVSDNPTTSRNLVLNVTDADGLGLTGAGRLNSFIQLTGVSNPFNGSPINFANANSFIDLDADGDLDLVTGNNDGRLRAFTNTAGAFTELTGSDNPFNAIDVGYSSDPAFADLDGDGDQDLVIGSNDGALRTFMNRAGAFSEATGAANPFNGVDVGSVSTPTFQDVDGDGDMDLIVGHNYGATSYFRNTTPRPSPSTITVNIAPQNDAPVATGLPTDVTVAADIAANLDLSAVTLTDVDTSTAITVILTATSGTLAASSGAGVTVTGSASGVLTLVGTASDIDAFLNIVSNIQYTGVPDVSGNNAATLTVTANDGSGVVTLGVVNIDIATSDDALEGTSGGETLSGLSGNDTLRGRGGNDILDGGSGIDLADYSTAAAGVNARLNSGTVPTDGDGGVDTLISIENLTGSAFNDTLVGDAGANVLSGGLGADLLVGLAGDDILIGGSGTPNTMQGGLGDDTYVVISNDTLTEFANQGTDTVQTDRTAYVLKTHFENLTYTGAGAFRGTGNAANNVIVGGVASDVLMGLGGNDTLDGAGGLDLADYSSAAGGVTADLGSGVVSADGDGGEDTLISIENLAGSAFADRLVGSSGVNVLSGGQGDDVLAGGGGNDSLIGGAGVDTADYSGAAAGIDARLSALAVRNDGDGGVDTLNSIENLTGSNFDDVLFGDAGANVLKGGLGVDILIGGAGNDVLIGGAGVANTLQGGLGDDVYVVSANDTINEFSGEGTDTVQTTRAFYNLAANIENLTFTGSGDFQGVGNALNNVISGGSGNDTLSGGQGNDVLNGGDGSADYIFVSGVLANYAITDLGGGSYRILDTVGGRDGSDVTHSVERIRFSDGSVATLASLASPLPAPLAPSGKAIEPQVLPGLVDDDFLPLGKGFGEPQVLPGGGVGHDLFGFTPLTGDWVLTLADPYLPALSWDYRPGDPDQDGWM